MERASLATGEQCTFSTGSLLFFFSESHTNTVDNFILIFLFKTESPKFTLGAHWTTLVAFWAAQWREIFRFLPKLLLMTF